MKIWLLNRETLHYLAEIQEDGESWKIFKNIPPFLLLVIRKQKEDFHMSAMICKQQAKRSPYFSLDLFL